MEKPWRRFCQHAQASVNTNLPPRPAGLHYSPNLSAGDGRGPVARRSANVRPEPGAPAANGVGSRARFPARDGIFEASFVVGSPRSCSTVHSGPVIHRSCEGADRQEPGWRGTCSARSRVIASNCTPGKSRKSGGIGSVSEVFDAEPPFTPRGCIAQAWSVAEVLRCLEKTAVEQE